MRYRCSLVRAAHCTLQEVLPALMTVLTKQQRVAAQHLLTPADHSSRQNAAGVGPGLACCACGSRSLSSTPVQASIGSARCALAGVLLRYALTFDQARAPLQRFPVSGTAAEAAPDDLVMDPPVHKLLSFPVRFDGYRCLQAPLRAGGCTGGDTRQLVHATRTCHSRQQNWLSGAGCQQAAARAALARTGRA